MMTRRLSTPPPPPPPVRFYKTIALSFLCVTVVLLGVVIYITSKKALITIVVKEDSRSMNLTATVAPSGSLGTENQIDGTVTTTVFTWSKKYFPTQSKPIDAVATGEVTIINKGRTDQPLVRTTRLANSTGVLFRLSEGVVVPASGQVAAKVYADQAGAAGNLPPSTFTIPGLSAEKQRVVYAESSKPMTGGTRQVAVLTAEDLAAAEEDYAREVKAAFLKEFPLDSATEKTVLMVTQKNNTPDKPVGSEISEFTLSGENTVVVVHYSVERLRNLINQELSKKFDLTSEKVLSANSEPQLSIANFDLEKKSAELSVYQDVLVTLDADAGKLHPSQFLGKKKADIERSILSLNHVSGVEVKFSPSWMLSAPSVPDKIKIVVKTVR